MQTKRIAQVSALTQHPDADKQLLKTERYTTYSDNEGVLIYKHGIEYVRHDAAAPRGYYGDPPCASCTSCTSGRGNASGASHTSGWKYASVSGNSEFPAGSVGGEERKVVLDDGR